MIEIEGDENKVPIDSQPHWFGWYHIIIKYGK